MIDWEPILDATVAVLAARAAVLLAALAIDWLVGEPDILWRRVPHPVVLFGRAISFMDKRLNRRRGVTGKSRQARGILAIVILVVLAAMLGWGLSFGGPVVACIILAVLLAARSLDEHIRAVATAMGEGIGAARTAVGMIVGRETKSMKKGDIARAAIETGAENLSDGVIAPALWFLVGGLPGLLAYKMVNTADSMIGYRNAKYRAFGCGAARIDDTSAPHGPVDLRGRDAERTGQRGARHDDARRQAPCLAECRLAGSRDGRSDQCMACRAATIRQPDQAGASLQRRRQ